MTAAFLAVLVAGLLFVTALWICGPVISAHSLKAIRGATKIEVRRLLGHPSEIMPYGDWIYDRPPTAGWVAISFDDSDRVWHINDEQALPDVFGSGTWYAKNESM